MNLEQIMSGFRLNPSLMENVTRWHEIPARAARYAPMPDGLDPRLISALKAKGATRLYTHQSDAAAAALAGENVVVVTPTASGKTYCYNIPVVDAILKDSAARALLLFPTKALSHDQSSELDELLRLTGAPIKSYTYDGDTPQSARKAIRQAGNVIVSNPDMLHGAILPNHTKWTRLFESLRFIVVDELHHYGGVFGCHLANVLRRLERICAFYGSKPQYICCSATIANPGELARRLIGRDARVVDNNGAPTAKKYFVFYNPPVVNASLGIRKSSLLESRQLATQLLLNDISTIVFTRSRLNVEVLTKYLRTALEERRMPGQKGGKRAGDAIRGYRGGYLPKLRREIEQGLREGAVRGVVSTNALELGIDIGSLEACVVCGYPGSIASLWQQAGRAGRRQGSSAVFLVATSSPLDQYIIRNPDYILGKSPEHGLINPDNFVILYNHIKCAAYELPFEEGETFGAASADAALDFMEEARIVRHVGGRWHWAADSFPAAEISLRSATNENFIIVDITDPDPVVIGEMDRFTAPMLLHEEAIYMHDARQHQVERLDFDDKKAYVRRVDVDYYTDANLNVDIAVIDVFRSAGHLGVSKSCGEVKTTAIVTLFKKIKLDTHENIGSGPVNLPELEMHTTAYWIELPEPAAPATGKQGAPAPRPAATLPADSDPGAAARMQADSGPDAAARMQDALIGLSNLLANAAPVFLLCDKKDIRVVSQTRSPFTKKPTVFIYDNYPGGVGFSDKLYELHDELLQLAEGLAEGCGCESGCPSCIGPSGEFSGKGNPKLDAISLIRRLRAASPPAANCVE